MRLTLVEETGMSIDSVGQSVFSIAYWCDQFLEIPCHSNITLIALTYNLDLCGASHSTCHRTPKWDTYFILNISKSDQYMGLLC